MRLSGKNFQPWADFGLEIDKLTILVGPSNKGKSSLFRAFRGILRNELDAAYIRDPKNEPMELTFEIGDTKVFATRNKRGKVKYVINDDEKNAYTSLDGNVPPPVQKLLFGEITVGDFTFDPIFAVQNDPQFLLDKRAYKPADLNAILGAFGGTERLESGKKEAGSRISDKNGEAKTLAEEIRNAEERKAKLTPMSVTGEQVAKELHGLELLIQQLDAKSVWVREARDREARLRPLEMLQKALVLPDSARAELFTRQVAYAQQAAKSWVLSKWLNKVVKAVDGSVEGGGNATAIWQVIAAVRSLDRLLTEKREFPDVISTEAETRFSTLVGFYSSIRLMGQVQELRRGLEEKTAELTQIDSELTQAQEELKKGLCPKCGKSLEHICERGSNG